MYKKGEMSIPPRGESPTSKPILPPAPLPPPFLSPARLRWAPRSSPPPRPPVEHPQHRLPPARRTVSASRWAVSSAVLVASPTRPSSVALARPLPPSSLRLPMPPSEADTDFPLSGGLSRSARLRAERDLALEANHPGQGRGGACPNRLRHTEPSKATTAAIRGLAPRVKPLLNSLL